MNAWVRTESIFTSSSLTRKIAGEYLHDLRNNRVPRPTGARPCPSPEPRGSSDHSSTRSLPLSRGSATSAGTQDSQPSGLSSSMSNHPSLNHPMSPRSAAERPSSSGYIDGGQRQKERVEAHMMRLALEGHEHDDEDGLVAEAKAEADELMRKHDHPHVPFRVSNPRPPDTKPTGAAEVETDVEPLKPLKKRSSLSRMNSACANALPTHRRKSSGQKRTISGKVQGVFPNPEDRIYEDPVDRQSLPRQPEKPTDSVGKREAHDSTPAAHVRRNPFARAQAARQGRSDVPYRLPTRPTKEAAAPIEPPEDSSGVVAQAEAAVEEEDQTTKYKDGIEVRSDDLRAATSFSLKNRSPKLPSPTAVSDNCNRPIVSFKPDWTPPKLEERERSPRSGTPQRPSPSRRWQQNEDNEDLVKSPSAPAVPTLRRLGPQRHNDCLIHPSRDLEPSPQTLESISPEPEVPPIDVPLEPTITVQYHTPAVPTISASDDPSNASSPSVPIINISDNTEVPRQKISSRRAQKRMRPTAVHAATAPVPSRPSNNPFNAGGARRTTALCSQCGLGIAGKIVSAAGVRFHPECFVCYTCKTQLECVAFYPEPDGKREDRLDRVHQRPGREDLGGEQDDGDDGLRFFCHLDFHEQFSPRCKTCKTPIEGEVIVACGGEYHAGHFFCAECGDVGYSLPTNF